MVPSFQLLKLLKIWNGKWLHEVDPEQNKGTNTPNLGEQIWLNLPYFLFLQTSKIPLWLTVVCSGIVCYIFWWHFQWLVWAELWKAEKKQYICNSAWKKKLMQSVIKGCVVYDLRIDFFSIEHRTILDKSEALDYELDILDVKNYNLNSSYGLKPM